MRLNHRIWLATGVGGQTALAFLRGPSVVSHREVAYGGGHVSMRASDSKCFCLVAATYIASRAAPKWV